MPPRGGRDVTFVDLFCGAGGFSRGMRDAGLTCLGGVDFDATACETYAKNHGLALEADARELTAAALLARLTGGVRPDVIVASPPCQSISACGASADRVVEADALWREAVRLARDVGAHAVVVENVSRFATKRDARGRTLASATESAMRAAGFSSVTTLHLDAADFGVPQRRRRAFVVGVRVAAAASPPRLRLVILGDSQKRTVADIIMSAAEVEASVERHAYDVRMSAAKCAYYRARAAARPDYVRFVDLKKPALTMRAGYLKSRGSEALVATDAAGEACDPAAAFAAVGGNSKQTKRGRGRAVGMRMFTVEEAAAIQGFPSDFVFLGCAGAKYRQIGNAVAPPVAAAIGRALVKCL